MVSTTLTTIVSSATGGSSTSSSNITTTTNNHQYQRPTHSTGGRNYYFATTNISGGDPKTTTPTATTTSPLLIETNINNSISGGSSSGINNCGGGNNISNSNNQNYHYQKLVSSCHSPTANITNNSQLNQSISITGHDIVEQQVSSLDLATTATKLNSTSSNQLNSYKNNDSIIFSSSPPLSDQISILFPKCRPKNDINSNPTQQKPHTQISELLSSSTESILIQPQIISSVEVTNSITSTTITSGEISNRIINSLNKSPPPSSLSSESQSSVTPRISTNPFLNNNHHQQQQQLDQSYRPTSFYYNNRTFSSSPLLSNKQKETNCFNEMPRKRNYHGGGSGSGSGSASNNGNNQNPFLNNSGSSSITNVSNKDIINTNYWETRHNTTPASTVLNSPELIENHHDSRNHHHFIQNQKHVKVGRSPVSHSAEQQQCNNTIELLDTPTHSRGLAVVADGEVVVFDDITENWQNLRVTTEPSNSSSPLGMTNIKESTTNLETFENNYKDINKKYLDRNYAMISESKPGIMVYEGSPRRIGYPEDGGIDNNISGMDDEDDDEELIEEDDDMSTQMYPNKGYQNQLSLYPARPGFPQRIISPPRESPPLPNSNFKQQQQQYHYQQQQQQQQQSTTTTIASNAEDTSNDVSEIGTSSDITTSEPPKSSTFDYLYEFSETRKVLEEFFKCPSTDEKPIENGSDADSIDIHYELHESIDNRPEISGTNTNNYIGQRLAGSPMENNYTRNNISDDIGDEDEIEEDEDEEEEEEEEEEEIDNLDDIHHQNNYNINGINAGIETNSLDKNNHHNQEQQQQHQHHDHQQQQHHNHDIDFFLDSTSRSSGEQCDNQDGINQNRVQSRSFRYSPETTDYDSNCGDLDSLSGEFNGVTNYTNYAKYYAASMPVLEDGLSSGHASDTENNNPPPFLPLHQQQQQQQHQSLLHQQPPTGISMLMDTKRISIEGNIDEATNHISNRKNQLSPNDIYCKLDSSPIKSIIEESGRDSVRSKRDILGQSPNSNCNSNKVFKNIDPDLDSLYSISVFHRQDLVQLTPPPPAPAPHRKPSLVCLDDQQNSDINGTNNISSSSGLHQDYRSAMHNQQQTSQRTKTISMNITANQQQQRNHLPPPVPERNSSTNSPLINSDSGIANSTIGCINNPDSPVWVPRHLDTIVKNNGSINSSGNGISNIQDSSTTQLLENHHKNLSADEDDVDTDLETDRLLGHQRLDDQGFYDDNNKSLSWDRKPRSLLASSLSKFSPKIQHSSVNKSNGSSLLRQGLNSLLPTTPEIPSPPHNQQTTSVLSLTGATSTNSITIPLQPPITVTTVSTTITTTSSSSVTSATTTAAKNTTSKLLDIGGSMSSSEHSEKSPEKGSLEVHNNCNLDSPEGSSKSKKDSSEKKTKKSKNKEGGGAVLIEGVLFRARYLGSTQLVCEGQPTKSTRMMQAEEAVSRIKAPDGDVQPSTEVDLFISTEKIMVLNTDLKEIMMDHALRTISYIADIGDLVVLMARRRFVPSDIDDGPKPNRTPKMICHVFESDEAQFIAQSIGQAFQVAYMEFLKANGIEDHSFVKEMDYQEVLNSQEIFGDELEIFAKKELQKEVVVPKAKGEILGVVIVESGWGSMLPTVVIANLMSTGAAARCGQLNIGDQLIAINGLSLVGLPLSTCQTYIKNSKNQTVVKFTVVPCPPVVEVKIKRPNTKYQLGFSVQNGVICSLLRGGIAERGGVRVGHRIIEINNQSVVAVPHEKIVNLLATSVGEILMKTMPTSMFRLLTGQENPIYI